jgi:hypothetical protein
MKTNHNNTKILLIFLVSTLLIPTVQATIIKNTHNTTDFSSADWFWMDFNPESDPHTIDGGRFENGEQWICNKQITQDDFDDIPDNTWSDSPGLYSEVRNDEDLRDQTTAEGAWCTTAREQGCWDEDSQGWTSVEKNFDLSQFINTDNPELFFTDVTLYCDYKIYSNDYDFDDLNSYLYFCIYIDDGVNEWPLEHQYFSNLPDTPQETYGGWCTDYWDPLRTEGLYDEEDIIHGHDPKYDYDDYQVSKYVTATNENKIIQSKDTLADLFNKNGDIYTLKFKLYIRLFGGIGGGIEEFQFWVDNVRMLCEYGYEPQHKITFDTEPSYSGSIKFNQQTYNHGDGINIKSGTYNLQAVESHHYLFSEWRPVLGAEITLINSKSTTVKINDDSIIKAVFAFDPTQSNQPPAKPRIQSIPYAAEGTPYVITLTTTDPENDLVTYYIDWGDGTDVEIGPIKPEVYTVTFNIYYKVDPEVNEYFVVSVKAIDEFGAESEWSNLKVALSKQKQSSRSLDLRSKIFYHLFEQLFQTSFLKQIIKKI